MKYVLLTMVLTLAFLIESKAQSDTLVIYLNNDQVEKIPLSQIHSFKFENVTSVGEQTKPSSGLKVRGNYPNPFNPSTSIRYTISNRQFVQLKVYDILGNEVAVLVNEEKPAGSYEVEFNAQSQSGDLSARSGYVSGVYFYQIKAGDYIQTNKMIYLK